MTAVTMTPDARAVIAETFVGARLAARPTPDYPGAAPRTMDEAYEVQDMAIGLFPDTIIGWKVGGIPPADQSLMGIHRLAGPIYSRNRWADTGGVNRLPAIEGGFAAVEAEFIARIGEGVDPAKTEWTLQEATAVVDAVFLGVELAGSPFPGINSLGAPVTASDFGNNAGLLIGQELTGWRDRMDAIVVETSIDGASVGTGGSTSLMGGAIESVRFLLEHCARRGRPLTSGILVSTGAVTGVHKIDIGSAFVCDFRGVGAIRGEIIAAGA